MLGFFPGHWSRSTLKEEAQLVRLIFKKSGLKILWWYLLQQHTHNDAFAHWKHGIDFENFGNLFENLWKIISQAQTV